MSALETKFPPPLVFLITAVVMILMTGGLHAPAWPFFAAALLAWLAGIGIAASAVLEFRRLGTTLDPHRPQEACLVVSSGVLRFTRNPIYLAFILMLTGLALFQASPWALLGPLAFTLYIWRFQVIPEERALAAKFGPAYEQYRSRVRRWL